MKHPLDLFCEELDGRFSTTFVECTAVSSTTPVFMACLMVDSSGDSARCILYSEGKDSVEQAKDEIWGKICKAVYAAGGLDG